MAAHQRQRAQDRARRGAEAQRPGAPGRRRVLERLVRQRQEPDAGGEGRREDARARAVVGARVGREVGLELRAEGGAQGLRQRQMPTPTGWVSALQAAPLQAGDPPSGLQSA